MVISRNYGRGTEEGHEVSRLVWHQQSSNWEDPKYETEVTGLEEKLW